MTTVHEFVSAALAIVIPIVAIGMLVCLALLAANIGDELRRKPLRARRRERKANRLTAAGADAVLQVDLDAWEAEMLNNLDAALPESWRFPALVGDGWPQLKTRNATQEFPKPRWPESWTQTVTPAPLTSPSPLPRPTHDPGTNAVSDSNVAARGWPQPLSPTIGHRVTAGLVADAQPMPARAEVAVHLTDPHWATTAPTYNGDAAEWRSERVDGVPVVDEQTYAGTVLQNLSRDVGERTAALAMSQAFGHVVDAMPVSPAPQGGPRHRHGSAKGTEAQRLDPVFISWEQPTGAFALVGVGAR